ncbi:hypothetical protein J8281_14890 [Aquimarina sp. U1-2]|uniref:hypothetical protein n=1 Tax=Aquimarina sp. U1-2 TaxID=2823141 RepID=UPI001AECB6F5|nr:hypothetical protein [Aquimarina sp. U1-2]MBP2833479.1 hypothetical protein [Aquimarina sp. U1-2]
MKKVLHIISYIVFLLFLPRFGYAQYTLSFKKGVVIDSLNVPNTKNTFSLYLPTNFETDKNWPIIFGFDSNNNVSSSTRLYKEAAEEFGYIVAISNFSNAQNLEEKATYIATFMDYVASMFPIQKGRVYVTALDEDARLVSLIPALDNKNVFGTIAIGDSYFYDSRIKIAKNFSYFGIVNKNNYRYKDFTRTVRYLKRKAIEADLFTFNGTSDYPYPKLLKKPLSSFTLHAMLKGRMPMDSVWVKREFQRALDSVEKKLRKQEFLYAYKELRRIQSQFHLFFDTDFLREKEKKIKRNKEFRKQRRLEAKYNSLEDNYRQTYLFLIEEDIRGVFYENMGWWQYQMTELDSIYKKDGLYSQNMVGRVKGYLKNTLSTYKSKLAKKPKNFEKRMFITILSTIVDHKDYESYKEIISLSAQDQDNTTALFYLERLLKNGYEHFEALYQIKGTLALRMSKEYNALIKKYLGKSKYFFGD